jgi:AhpD family alkylhydroperoxidase
MMDRATTRKLSGRIATPPNHAYSWYVRLIFALQRRKYGAELQSARLWGRLPRTFLMLTLLYRSIDRKGSPIDPALRSLVQVRVSQINGCEFCVDLNSAAGLERGLDAARLEALAGWERSSVFDEREKAVLAYAEAVTDPARRADDVCFARLRAFFDEQGVLELTALIAFQNLSSKFNAALALPAQGLCALPGRGVRK